MIERWHAMSRAAQTVTVFAAALATLFLVGGLSAQSDVSVSGEEAIELARPHIDFEPVDEGARLIRSGFGLRGIWAVSFSIPGGPDSDETFERITVVEVDGHSGEVTRVSTDVERGQP